MIAFKQFLSEEKTIPIKCYDTHWFVHFFKEDEHGDGYSENQVETDYKLFIC